MCICRGVQGKYTCASDPRAAKERTFSESRKVTIVYVATNIHVTDDNLLYCRTGSRGRRARYTVTVVNRGIKVSALASTPKAAKMAAAKAALARLHKLD